MYSNSRSFQEPTGQGLPRVVLEEDKHATTNMQKGLLFFFFILFQKGLDFKKGPGGKFWKGVKKCDKCGKCEKGVKKCRNDFAL